jgi:hypothetical protein
VGKPGRRRQLERLRHRWEDSTKCTFESLDGEMDWIDLAQDWNMWRALVNAVMNLRVPSNAGSFLSSLERVSFSERTLLSGII